MAKKKLSVVLIPRRDDKGAIAEPYAILDECLKLSAHKHLDKAKIALAWNLSWKADADGRLVLGKCKKASDLDRQLHRFDFVILLNKPMWEKWIDPFGGVKLKRALMDHELCHAAVSLDGDGNVKKDEQGRICYRVRGHDLEEFREIIDRHGVWKTDIEAFARSLIRKAKEKESAPLLSVSK